MNDNEQKYSSTPYRASGNLNTIIGNPNININSATTSNIMEGDSTNTNHFEQSQSLDYDQNNQILNSDMSNNNIISNLNNNSFDQQKDNDDSISSDPVRDFINRTSNVSNNIFENNVSSGNFNVESNHDHSSVNTISNNTVSNNYQSTYLDKTGNNTASSNVNNAEVRYENVYNERKPRKEKKGIKIPSEFKTAVIVVIILLLLLSCFDVVYDFFKNFWINL